jgi:hypothetical protein
VQPVVHRHVGLVPRELHDCTRHVHVRVVQSGLSEQMRLRVLEVHEHVRLDVHGVRLRNLGLREQRRRGLGLR